VDYISTLLLFVTPDQQRDKTVSFLILLREFTILLDAEPRKGFLSGINSAFNALSESCDTFSAPGCPAKRMEADEYKYCKSLIPPKK
jgi:hypothetical protein